MGEAMSTYDYLHYHPVVDQLLDTSKEPPYPRLYSTWPIPAVAINVIG